MQEDLPSFYMLLSSDASKALSKNTSADFKNVLPYELDVEHYKVALQALNFECRFSPIPIYVENDKYPHITITNRFLFERNKAKILKEKEEIKVKVAQGALSATKRHRTKTKFIRPAIEIYFNSKNYSSLQEVVNTIQHLVSRKNITHITARLTDVNEKYAKINIKAEGYIIWIRRSVNKWFNVAYEDDPVKDYYVYNDEVVSDFIPHTIIPKSVSVVLNQAKQNNIHTNAKPLLFKVPFSSNYLGPKSKSFYYEVTGREYYDLQTTRLTELDISLLDENNNTLSLTANQPTIIKLKFNQMESNDGFIVRFSSKISSSYPNNTPSINYPVDLDEHSRWNVALTSIHFPSKINIVIPDDLYVIIDNPSEAFSTKVNILRDTIYSNTTLVTALTDILEHLGIGVRLNEEKNVQFKGLSDPYIPYQLTFSENLTSLLGGTISNDKEETFTVPTTVITPFYDTIRVESFIPHSFFLYTDIIHPIVVASKYVQILKLIPVIPNVTTYYESQHLDFVPLINNRLAHTHFEIRLASGELINFHENDKCVELCLLFRRIK